MADLLAAMAALTAARVEQMLDACTAVRPSTSGQTPALDDTGQPTGAAATQVYAGPCLLARFKSTGVRASISPTPTDLAGVPEPRTLKVPHTADLRPGDVVTITTAVFAPALAGQQFLVLHEDPRSYATFRSFTVRGSSWAGATS